MPELDEDEVWRRATAAAQDARPGAVISAVRPLEGGISSLTYAAMLDSGAGEQPIVVKVAPPGLAPVHNRDVLRQARVLARLAPVASFPAPAVLFSDASPPPLFAMELCAGQAYEPLLDVSSAPPDPATAATRMRVAARTLARLHAAAPDSLGLADEPVTPVAGELARWSRLFATVPADLALGHAELCDRLLDRLPGDEAPAVLHGDYRLANMLFVGSRLTGVIDWEIWSLGDPRSDVAWLLMHTAPAHVMHEDRSQADLAAGSALPSANELLGDYLAERRVLGADEQRLEALSADLGWFLALAHYKVASTMSVLIKRNRRSATPDRKLEVAARHLDEVVAAGHRMLDDAMTA
jgi:aminoglycoside phosphotransferase (APT) family kinase protein